MPTLDQLFPSKYLKTTDLDGHEVTVMIERVLLEPAGKLQQMKPVVHFVGKKKGLILNRTNADRIGEITGSRNTDDWPGKTIRLYVTYVAFQGKQTPAIRVTKGEKG